MSSLPSAPDRPEAVPSASDRLEAVAPGYLERVRQAAAALGLGGGTDSDAALAALHDAAGFDLDPPVLSPSPAARYAKVAVKRLGAWYIRYLGEQLEVFAAAAASLGDVLVRQAERLEERTAALQAQLDDLAGEHHELAERVARLEGVPSGQAERGGAGPGRAEPGRRGSRRRGAP